MGENDSISRMERKVFKYDSSEADKRFFKEKIVGFVREKPAETYTQFLYNITWLRNNKGETTKYMFFNENEQRVFLDRDFYSWAIKMIALVEQEYSLAVLNKAFEWHQISAPQFKRMLYYNTKTGVYETENKVVEATDERLIAYLEMFKNMKPTSSYDGFGITGK